MTLPGCACMDERFKIIYKKGKMFGCLHINWVFLFLGTLYNASYIPETEPSHVFFVIIIFAVAVSIYILVFESPILVPNGLFSA